MNRIIILACCLLVFGCKTTKESTEGSVVAANDPANEISKIKETIDGLYSAISFDKGENKEEIDLLFMESRLAPGAKFVHQDPESGKLEVLSAGDFVNNVEKNRNNERFVKLQEIGLSYDIKQFNDIAHCYCPYSLLFKSSKTEMSVKGTNLIQLAKIDGVWKFISVMWTEDPKTMEVKTIEN